MFPDSTLCFLCEDGIKADHGEKRFNEDHDQRTCNQLADYARYITTTELTCNEILAEAREFSCPASGIGIFFSVLLTGAMVIYNLIA